MQHTEEAAGFVPLITSCALCVEEIKTIIDKKLLTAFAPVYHIPNPPCEFSQPINS